jgi:hypothetical protein
VLRILELLASREADAACAVTAATPVVELMRSEVFVNELVRFLCSSDVRLQSAALQLCLKMAQGELGAGSIVQAMMKPMQDRADASDGQGSNSRFSFVVALMSADDKKLAVEVAALFRYLLHTQPTLANVFAEASLPQFLQALCCVDGDSELLSPNQCAVSLQYHCALSVFVGLAVAAVVQAGASHNVELSCFRPHFSLTQSRKHMCDEFLQISADIGCTSVFWKALQTAGATVPALLFLVSSGYGNAGGLSRIEGKRGLIRWRMQCSSVKIFYVCYSIPFMRRWLSIPMIMEHVVATLAQLTDDFQTGLPATLVREDELLWHTALRASSSCLLCVERKAKTAVISRLTATILQHELLFAITDMLLSVAEDELAPKQAVNSCLVLVHLLQMLARVTSPAVEGNSFPQMGLITVFFAKKADVLLRLLSRSVLLPPVIQLLADISSVRTRVQVLVASSDTLFEILANTISNAIETTSHMPAPFFAFINRIAYSKQNLLQLCEWGVVMFACDYLLMLHQRHALDPEVSAEIALFLSSIVNSHGNIVNKTIVRKNVVSCLVELLGSSDPHCVQCSLKCLREFSRDSKLAAPLLLEARVHLVVLQKRIHLGECRELSIELLLECRDFVAANFPDHPQLVSTLNKAVLLSKG